MSEIKKIALDGFWKQNPGVVQLLGLCPTLAVTTSMINGLSLGIATAIVMAVSNASVSPIRKFIPTEIRVPVFILIIASLVTIIDFSIHAFIQPLYKALGIFIPLIVTNCIVLARVESFAAKNETTASFFDGLFMGLGLAMVLTLLGGFREFFGKGTLLSGIDLILGPSASNLVIHFFGDYHGFLLAILPPGAFIGLACLIALKNRIEAR
ncbi:MAG TPA: electron transport complex subunit RsxE [Methylophilaceae bacterium]|jgi:electron transport complex protein RnfE|nr:electron transport complex subunit RsxE [Methylophilaceae bacterium]HAP04619.1 electron transport complex subunit RsxE [Methylophilaceae bacterium]HBO18172.1 electron transport complex subunit RsxE [Methylophilaceae bacterium]HCB67811.1 electron transport complex subunit RsxE [Methylophilaceae bacterium]HCC72719.1 electron transport complex subunit RsxE [Methylophilaceae bacterium]